MPGFCRTGESIASRDPARKSESSNESPLLIPRNDESHTAARIVIVANARMELAVEVVVPLGFQFSGVSNVRMQNGQSRLRGTFDLFLISCTVLFLELAAIRWFPAYVISLTFFTNVVLLAAFVGMSIG